MKNMLIFPRLVGIFLIATSSLSPAVSQNYSSAIRPSSEVSQDTKIDSPPPPAPRASPAVTSKPKAKTAAPKAAASKSARSPSSYFEPFETTNSLNIPDGDIVIDIEKRRLFYSLGSDVVMVYPVAVGREGAAWKGKAIVGRMVDGPTWFPTAEQRSKKKLPAKVNPGPGNPLGSHAIYLFQGGKDTLIRIHGTNNPSSIGKAVSDGCFRMRNEHVEELFGYVQVGARVTVR